jgi:hypothetical protein
MAHPRLANNFLPLTPGRDAQIFDFSRLRDDGRKAKVVPGIFVNDHRGFSFDFHLVWRYSASAFKCWKNHFPDFVQGRIESRGQLSSK